MFGAENTVKGAASDINRGNKGPQNVYNLPAEWSLSNVDAARRLSIPRVAA